MGATSCNYLLNHHWGKHCWTVLILSGFSVTATLCTVSSTTFCFPFPPEPTFNSLKIDLESRTVNVGLLCLQVRKLRFRHARYSWCSGSSESQMGSPPPGAKPVEGLHWKCMIWSFPIGLTLIQGDGCFIDQGAELLPPWLRKQLWMMGWI